MLQLYHPGVANIDCRDCQKRLYDYETGKPRTWKGVGGLPIYSDGPSHKPQCRTHIGCPKVSPEEAYQYELTDANWKTLRLYRQLRAAGFQFMSAAERRDTILRRHFGILDEIFRNYDRKEHAKDVANELLPILISMR